MNTTTKRWSWNHKNHSPSLQTHTFNQNNLWLYRISKHLQVYERKNTIIMKGTNYSWVYRNKKVLMIKPWTSAQLFNNLVKLLKNFFQNQSQTHCIWYQTSIFCFKRKVIFIALKTSRSRQHLWAKTILIHIQNILTGFKKSCYEMSQWTGWKVVLTCWIG